MNHLIKFKTFESQLSLKPGPIEELYSRIILYKVADRIWAVVIPHNYLRSWVFLRCQEYYESTSPYFKNNRFTWKDYMNWYQSEQGPRGKRDVFTYANDWAGFNLPSEVIEDCLSEIKDPNHYDDIMISIVNTIKSNESGNFYLLGISEIDNVDNHLLDHELAHGMWYTDSSYKSEMNKLLSEMDKKSVESIKKLIAEIGYAESVISDEAQAYLATGIYDEWMVDDIPNWTDKFKEVFDRYKSKHLLSEPKKYEVNYSDKSLNESIDESNIIEDVALEYFDKYYLTDYNTIKDDDFGNFWKDDAFWGWYNLTMKYQKNDKLVIYVKKDKVNKDEFYQDMENLSKRLESIGYRNMTKKYDTDERSKAVGFSLTLITKSTPLR